MSSEPETDWHKEAQMYAECLQKVKAFCDEQHSDGRTPCPECQTKRQVLKIIAENLK